MNILWVENHQRFSQIAVSRFLPDHRVTVVPSLAAARQILATEQFNIVLVDYDLDDGKGADLVAEIKSQSNPPVVIATSSNADGNEKLVGAGADAVCSKMEFSNIENVLRRVCEKHTRFTPCI